MLVRRGLVIFLVFKSIGICWNNAIVTLVSVSESVIAPASTIDWFSAVKCQPRVSVFSVCVLSFGFTCLQMLWVVLVV